MVIEQLIKFIESYPAQSIVGISAAVTLVSTLATKWLTNQQHLKSLRVRQKEIQKDLKNHKPGEKKFEELQNELLQISMITMKSSFKPLLVTFVPFLLLFVWIKGIYSAILEHWIWYYIISSLIFSLIYRKVFKMA